MNRNIYQQYFWKVSEKSMIIHTNQISIDFKDTDYAKGAEVSVQNAMEGSVPHVGIEYTKDCTVQKEMGKSIVYTGSGREPDAGAVPAAEMLAADEFAPADFISRSMTGEDAAEIEEDGTILEEYVASSLERAIQRVKSQRRSRQDAEDKRTEKVGEQREHFDEMEQRILEAAQMASEVKGMSDTSVKYFLENNLDFSPADIRNCSTVSSKASGMSTYSEITASFETVKKQVGAILENSGMDVNEENLETAKWLYENEIPVTGENVRACQMLQELKDVSQEILTERIADEVIDGAIPEAANFTNISRDEAEQKLEALVQISDEELQKALSPEMDFITAKRQLEEIRLSMTIDAARTMENKGIHLDVQNLMEIVEELRAMEQEACRTVLVQNGVEDTSENISLTAETLRAASDILAAPVAVYGRTIATAVSDTILDVAAAGNRLRGQMEGVSEAYEAVGTEVRKDLGDSISKAFSNVDDILADLKLAPTAANERAVRILAYNRMPLSGENILSMKEYDDKVTTLVKNLKPQVTAELIRRQQNPLEMNLDELSEAVIEISDEISQEDISLRRYLWKLDHSNGISEDERKSMIGIYRLLDKVQKSDGAVIGQVVKEGRELSFSSLLSAVRSRKAQGMDQIVDDEFGALEEAAVSGENISSQISAGFGSSMTAKLQKALSPAVLKSRKDTYMEESLEIVLDECVNSEEAIQENKTYYESLAADIRETAGEMDERVAACLREMNMPESIVNIAQMKTYLGQGGKSSMKRYSKEESKRIIDAFDEPEELQEVFDEIDDVHKAFIEEQKESESIRYEDIKELAQMAGSISFYRQMRQFQKFEVPIVTEQGVTACSVTVRQGKEYEKGTVEISLDSPRFGQLQATYKVSGDKVSGFVTSEEEGVRETVSEVLSEFEKDLEMNGLTMEREDFAKGRRNSFHSGDKINETATNNKLYLVAKLFIQNVQRRDDET